MKIMKIVYSEIQEDCDWDGSNTRHFMGENSWAVGEPFAGEFIQGMVYRIVDDEPGFIDVWVIPKESTKPVLAISFPIHTIQRIYYGE